MRDRPEDLIELGIVTDHEWRWVILAATGILLLGLLPFLHAAANAPPGTEFSGFLVGAAECHSYLAKMRQGWDGAWRFQLPYTPEPQRGAAVYLPYLGLGHLGRIARLPLPLVFHLARLAAGLFLLATVYRFAAALTGSPALRRLVFLAAGLTGGIGYTGALAGHLRGVDLWIPESNTFFSLLTYPHFPLSFALLLWLPLIVDGNGSRWRQSALALLAGAALAAVQPFLLPAALLVLGAGLAFPGRRRRLLPTLAAVAGLLAVAAFIQLEFRRDPLIAAWIAQQVMPSPGPGDYLLGAGLLLPLAAAGVVGCWRQLPVPGKTLAVWLAAIPVLVYLPVPFQRRLVSGAHLPLAILAALGLRWLLDRFRPRLPGGATTVVAVLALGNLLLLVSLFQAPALRAPGIFIGDDERRTLDWLDRHAPAGSVVLAPPAFSLLVPSYTSARVVYGHIMETVDAARRRREVEDYFAGQLPDPGALLARDRVGFVVAGGSDGTRRVPGAEVVFRSGALAVARVPSAR